MAAVNQYNWDPGLFSRFQSSFQTSGLFRRDYQIIYALCNEIFDIRQLF